MLLIWEAVNGLSQCFSVCGETDRSIGLPMDHPVDELKRQIPGTPAPQSGELESVCKRKVSSGESLHSDYSQISQIILKQMKIRKPRD